MNRASTTGSGSKKQNIVTKEQKTFLTARYKQFYVEGWDELSIKLKKRGGEMIVPLPEPRERVQLLLSSGHIFNTTKLKLQKGEPSNCHGNASRIWAKNKHLQLVTGYALDGDDKLWRQHSWVWNPKNSTLIETTEPFKRYFGAVLTDVQALMFVRGNVPEFRDHKKVPELMLERLFKLYDLAIEEKMSRLMVTHGY
jgi:hypothetical protein